MSAESLMDTMKAEYDFCSICLRTKAEVKLDPISNKMYQMFFLGLVKCGESMKASSICVWCRRRVMNALKLVETAQTTNRILANISLLDQLQSQSFKQIVWDQIQANKRMHGLTPRTSRVISYSLPPAEIISLPMKLECEDGVSGEEGNVYFDSVNNEDQLHQIQDTKETPVSTLRTSEVVPCNLLPHTGIDSLVKLEHDDEITIEEENIHLYSVNNDSEQDLKDPIALEGHDFSASRLGSEIDDKSSELDIAEETPCSSEVRKWNDLKTYKAPMKKVKEIEVMVEVSKPEPIDADDDQNSASEAVREEPSSEFDEQVSNNGLQNGQNLVEVEVSDTNSQTKYSSADAIKYVYLLHLTETQLLQELEEKKREAQYRNATLKCEPCVLSFTFRGTYEAHMARHSESYGNHKCLICGVYFKNWKSYQSHCKSHYERYACAVCGLNFLTRRGAVYHFVSHHTNERFECEHCASKFGNAYSLKAHMKTVHNATRPLFPCTHCSRVLSTRSSYKIHMVQHNSSKRGDEPYSHRCDVCSRMFSTASSLRGHRATHFNKKLFP